MTISYAGNFAKLLFRWKGSIWKSIWKELIVYLIAYFVIRGVYQGVLSDEPSFNDDKNLTQPSQKENFARLARLFNDYTKQIPLTFLLGFYVALIVGRWWQQFQLVSWPDDLLAYTCYIWSSDSKQDIHARYTIARYINLACALCWRDISVKVRRRFPTTEHVLRCGLITENELALYKQVRTEAVRWQLPLTWIQRMLELRMADKEARPIPPPFFTAFMGEIKSYRTAFRQLYCYDWVCVPLVYTQVAAIATYGYFAICLIGRQTLDGEVDVYFPFFTTLQFVFYVGWFKVGQDLMRPFGTDDDDIELNYILDRNVQASFSLVHTVIKTVPKAVTNYDDFDANSSTQKLMTMVANTAGVELTASSPTQPGKTLTVLPHTNMSAAHHDHPPKLHAHVRLATATDGEEAQMDTLLPTSEQIRSRLPRVLQRMFKAPSRHSKDKRHRQF